MVLESLTSVERLFLANQFKLLAILDKSQAESYENRIEILESGYRGEYYRLFQNFSDEKDSGLSIELHSILNMFRHINDSISDLSDDDKSQLELDNISFNGFDQNNDDHYNLMEFWVNDLGLYAEYREQYINSHSQWSLEKYRSMLNVYNDLKNRDNRKLSTADLEIIVKSVGY